MSVHDECKNSFFAFAAAIVSQPQGDSGDLKCFLKARAEPFFAFLILYKNISNLVRHYYL